MSYHYIRLLVAANDQVLLQVGYLPAGRQVL